MNKNINEIISGLVNSAFIKYYTDYVGLDPKWMGYVFIIFTIWAAINDPIFGIWMDRRPYRKGVGKYRPVFIKSIPFWIVITLAFPWASPSWSQLGISIYLFFALALWESASTIFSIAYGAIAVNLFLTTSERAEVEVIDNYVGALAIFGSSIPIMILSMDVSNQTMLLFFAIVTIASGLIIAISILSADDYIFFGRIHPADFCSCHPGQCITNGQHLWPGCSR